MVYVDCLWMHSSLAFLITSSHFSLPLSGAPVVRFSKAFILSSRLPIPFSPSFLTISPMSFNFTLAPSILISTYFNTSITSSSSLPVIFLVGLIFGDLAGSVLIGDLDLDFCLVEITILLLLRLAASSLSLFALMSRSSLSGWVLL